VHPGVLQWLLKLQQVTACICWASRLLSASEVTTHQF
jgi:hypothetical protein